MDPTELIVQLAGHDVAQRRAAAEALARLSGEAVRAAAVALAAAAGDEDEEVREWAVAALEQAGPPHLHDVPAMVRLLEDSRSDVAYWAATLLGRLEAAAAPAGAGLARSLDVSRPLAVRQRAAWALGRIGPAAGDAAREALQRAARDPNPRLARLAQQALER